MFFTDFDSEHASQIRSDKEIYAGFLVKVIVVDTSQPFFRAAVRTAVIPVIASCAIAAGIADGFGLRSPAAFKNVYSFSAPAGENMLPEHAFSAAVPVCLPLPATGMPVAASPLRKGSAEAGHMPYSQRTMSGIGSSIILFNNALQ